MLFGTHDVSATSAMVWTWAQEPVWCAHKMSALYIEAIIDIWIYREQYYYIALLILQISEWTQEPSKYISINSIMMITKNNNKLWKMLVKGDVCTYVYIHQVIALIWSADCLCSHHVGSCIDVHTMALVAHISCAPKSSEIHRKIGNALSWPNTNRNISTWDECVPFWCSWRHRQHLKKWTIGSHLGITNDNLAIRSPAKPT